jgi:hypothetical protein
MYLFPSGIRIGNTTSLGILIFFVWVPLFSQNIVNQQKENENIFIARNKQFDEFADRFNFLIDFYGNQVDSAFRTKMTREKMISLLFDLKDPRSQPSNSWYSDEYVKSKSSFVKEVVKKNIYLNKYSPNIIAEARTRVIYNEQPHTVTICLNQEIGSDGSVKWVLLSAKSDLFNIFKPDTSVLRFIPPGSNETGFIDLKRALEDVDHLQDYASSDFEPDFLTLFFYFVKMGLIKYEYAEEIYYHIIDIPGWYIKVQEFNRNELNSGWLISDVRKNSLSLEDFLKSI